MNNGMCVVDLKIILNDHHSTKHSLRKLVQTLAHCCIDFERVQTRWME